MPTIGKVSPVMIGLCIALSVLALIIYAVLLSLLSGLAASDAAGNAYAQAYAAIGLVALWLLLFVIAIVALVNGAAGWPVVTAAVVLLLVSGIVSLVAMGLLASPRQPPYLWPIAIPAGVPPLVIAFSFWLLLPGLRATLPASVVLPAIGGAVLLLCVAIVPLAQMRESYKESIAAARARTEAAYADLPPNAALADLLPFMGAFYSEKEIELNKRIRRLPTRQQDAEAMLARGDFPLRYLNQLDLDPTPSLCDKARAQLRQQAAALALTPADGKPFATIAQPVSDAVSAMKWLVGHDCSCDAESLAWEQLAGAYTGTNYDVFELKRLRDPRELGLILREYPEKFSMLTPKASLKAWLGFADQDEYRDRALAGARTLPHRHSDIVGMLNDRSDISAPWLAITYLPSLDLAVSPELCRAALGLIDLTLADVYRPKPDDPRSYDELLDRLGGRGRHLTALIWLAGHGCDAAATIANAEALVRSYQPSAEREAMLASLAALPRAK